jgi:hypothetical protein
MLKWRIKLLFPIPFQGDNAELSYYVIDPGGALSIDPVTGSLTVLDPTSLDREQHGVYTVKVEQSLNYGIQCIEKIKD